MTALISKLKFNPLYLHLQGPNYGLDGLNITMHTEVVIHLMNAYVWCWSKICGCPPAHPPIRTPWVKTIPRQPLRAVG